MPVIGIDLGTTYCCVGTFIHRKVEIIANDHGNRTTASYVAFTDSERLIGDAAKNQVGLNAQNTVFDAKRLIGREYDDSKVLEDIQRWPFKVDNVDGKPMVSVEFKGEQKQLAPEQVSAMLLTKMKETAEAYLNQPVTEAVITVPAYFNDSQRQATKDAGTIAGLRVLGILNEPTAAALAYGLEKSPKGKRTVLIFDLGGGTFDVSLLTIDEASKFEVLAVAGDTHLGGEDFDSRLVKYCADVFKRKYKMDLSTKPKALRRLRTAAESAKRTLSFKTESTISVDGLYEGIDFCTNVSRARFEELCSDLLSQTLQPVQSVLDDAKMDKSQIDDIVLVGGSTRIPKVNSLLESFFGGRKLNQSINPDEAVAYGAAIKAAMLAGDMSSEIRDLLLVDVVPLSLGTAVISDNKNEADTMSKVIERNTKIPCKHTETLFTVHDNQTELSIKIFEGEHDKVARNHLLGSFLLTGIPAGPPWRYPVDVTFDLDANGILSVTAKERSTGSENSITIQHDKGRLSSSAINRMIVEAKKFDEEDKLMKQKRESRNKLEDYVFRVLARFQRTDDKRKQAAQAACDDTVRWLEAEELQVPEQYEEKLNSLDEVCAPLLAKLALNADDEEDPGTSTNIEEVD